MKTFNVHCIQCWYLPLPLPLPNLHLTGIGKDECKPEFTLKTVHPASCKCSRPELFLPAGVELGGALKNVLAIACGISDGLGFGNNGRAALITRGLMEMTRLAVANGAHPLTMSGLAGIGDLVLTCTGMLHRLSRTAI